MSIENYPEEYVEQVLSYINMDEADMRDEFEKGSIEEIKAIICAARKIPIEERTLKARGMYLRIPDIDNELDREWQLRISIIYNMPDYVLDEMKEACD